MSKARLTLADYLKVEAEPELAALVQTLGAACAAISALVNRGALADALGSAVSQNVQGETQKKLDIIANDLLISAAEASGQVAAIASEEEDEMFAFPNRADRGPFLLLFDPLDGSSNIDVNLSIGTIFSILPAPAADRPVTASDFLQPGRAQLAAGYALYGPQTNLVLSVSDSVVVFTLDLTCGEWVLTSPDLRLPASTREFAINASNARHWAAPVRAYVDECIQGASGPRAKDFNMRWTGSMVADVHRILTRGGVFLYPWDAREPSKPGKLRLMYEANPLGLLVERAGGAARDDGQPILDIAPHMLHQRVPVFLGTAEEIERLAALHTVGERKLAAV